MHMSSQMPAGYGVGASAGAPLGAMGILPMRTSMPMRGSMGGCNMGGPLRVPVPGSGGTPLTVLPTFMFPQIGPDGQLSLVQGRPLFPRDSSPEIPESKRRASCVANSADSTKTPGFYLPTSEAPFMFSGGMVPPSSFLPRAFSPVGFAAISNGAGVRVGGGGPTPGYVNPTGAWHDTA
jgi:hypothetical protein